MLGLQTSKESKKMFFPENSPIVNIIPRVLVFSSQFFDDMSLKVCRACCCFSFSINLYLQLNLADHIFRICSAKTIRETVHLKQIRSANTECIQTQIIREKRWKKKHPRTLVS